MKRLALVAVAAALFASTAAIAVADDSDVDTGETREFNEVQLRKARLLADYVVGDDDPADTVAVEEELTNLRTGDTVIGWGAMFKLLQLAKATDMSLADLLAEFDAEDGWAFGRRFKALTNDERSRLDDTPKNLGQLKKQQRDNKDNRSKKSTDG